MRADLLGRLLDAGFTKDEIMKLAADEKAPEPTPEPTPEPNPEPTPEPNSEPAPEQMNQEMNNRLTAIETNIANLVKAVQLNNLKNDSFGGNPDSLETQTDKIMASIIRQEPERKE